MKTVRVKVGNEWKKVCGSRKERRSAVAESRKKRHRVVRMTIREWFGDGKDGLCARNTNCNPLPQRPPVKTFHGRPDAPEWNEKYAGIIESILWDSIGLGTIILAEMEDDLYFVFASVDGGHRKRAIKAFVDGALVIKTPCGDSVVWNSLMDEEQKAFMDAELSFDVYKGLSNYDRGHLFRTINITTEVKPQEQLNAFGMTDVACGIRGFVDGRGDEPRHLFFEPSGLNVERFVNIEEKNSRLALEELTSRIHYVLSEGKLVSHTHQDLEKMFDVGKWESKKMNDFFNTLLRLRESKRRDGRFSKNRLKSKEIRVFTWLHSTLGNYTINDYDEFYSAFADAWQTIYDEDSERWTDLVDGKVTYASQFDTFTSHWGKLDSMQQVVEWFLEEFDVDRYITRQSDKRVASKSLQEKQFMRQKKCCQVELDLYDAGIIDEPERCLITETQCAHKIPYVEGSECNLGDFLMIKEKYHKKQFQQNYDTFIKQLIKDKKMQKTLDICIKDQYNG
tara:strand:- start:989 stop:2509 length:1521 start_codon:yes stop_codon:yes gene_type:complete